VQAQNILYGKVTDQSGQPLPGTNVFFPALSKGTITGFDGRYRIGNIPNGKKSVQFSFVGYHTRIVSVNAYDSTIILDIKLREAPVQAQEIVITGGYISSQHDNAVKIEVLKKEPIFRSGNSNFMEAITKVPGVEMISRGQGIAKPVIRGLSMNNVLTLFNGTRIENYQYGENHPLGIDGNGVGRVEIIKGPASLLHGSDAIGGVINFISEQPAPVGQIRGDYQFHFYSNTTGFNHNLGIRGASNNLFAGMNVSQKSHCDYLQGSGEFVPNSRFNEYAFNLNFGYTGKVGTSSIYYSFFDQHLGMTTKQSVQLVNENNRKNELWYQDLNYQLVSSQNKFFLGERVWQLDLGLQRAYRKLITLNPVPEIEMRLNTITLDSKCYLLNDDNKEIILGFQGMNQNNRNQHDRNTKLLSDADINSLGFFGVVQYAFFQKMKVQGGLRYDFYFVRSFATGDETDPAYKRPITNNFQSLNGSFGATYHFNDRLLMRMNIARAFRAPNLAEMTSNGIHAGRYEKGNPDLLPQEAMEIDLSSHLHTDNISLDLALFNNQISDYIFLTPTNDTTKTGDIIFRYAQNHADLFGGEMGIHIHPRFITWLHFIASYSYVRGRQRNGDNLPFIPPGKLRYEVRVEKKRLGILYNPGVMVSGLFALEQQKASSFETPTDGYSLLNVSLNSDIKIGGQFWNFGVSFNNLFDTSYFDHLSTLKQLGFYNPGREVSIRLRIPFVVIKNGQEDVR
jgi:iron complex outermembrane receptor protein